MGAGVVSVHAAAPPSTALLWFCAAALPYGWLVWRRATLSTRDGLVAVVGVGALCVAAPVAFSDDLYRFLWDARVASFGIDPYQYAPSDPALQIARDGLWRQVNNPEVPTIYPPVAQWLFRGMDGLGHAPWSPRLVGLLGHLGVGFALTRLPAALGRGDDQAGVRIGMAFWLNPLALQESALGGHIDVFVGLAVLGFGWALATQRVWRALLFVALASGLKLIGLVLAPLIGIRDRKVMVLALVVCLVPIVPLIGAGEGTGVTGGLGQYARRWRGNEGLYGGVEAGAAWAVRHMGEEVGTTRVRFDQERALFAALQGTRFDPRASFLGEKKQVFDPAEFEVHVIASALARAMVFLCVVGLALGLAWRRTPPLVAIRWVLLSVLLLSPQVHPWYLLWLLPLELALRRWTVVVWSIVAFAAYAPLDGWIQDTVWLEPRGLTWVQYGLVLTTLGLETAWGRWPRLAGVPKVEAPARVSTECSSDVRSTATHTRPSTAIPDGSGLPEHSL